ncbi:MAG: InlB B-repeat-containing protein [Clostridia bacterium]|nr:InlB B-repeat-containing protein [Clostridia bacterium]
MEAKGKVRKKGKRSISVLTIFLWLALIVVMSVITITGMNKENALEGSRTITVKIDFSTLLNDLGITDPEEIKSNLEGISEILYSFKTDNVTSESDILQATTRYIGLEEETIGIYEIDIPEEGKYIGIDIPTYEILGYEFINDSTKIPEFLYYYQDETVYGLKLYDDINEYHLTVQRIEPVVMNLDISETNDFNIDSVALFVNNCLLSFPTLIEEDNNLVTLNIYPNLGIDFDIVFSDYKVLENGQDLDIKELFGNYYYYKNIKKDELQTEYQLKLTQIEKFIEIRLNVIGEIKEEYDIFLKETSIEGVLDAAKIIIPFDRKEKNTYIYKYLLSNEDLGKYFEIFSNINLNGVNICIVNKNNKIYIQDSSDNFGSWDYIFNLRERNLLSLQLEFLEENVNKTYVTNQIKWVDENKGIAKINLGHNSYYFEEQSYIQVGKSFVYYNKLADEFELSTEYELDSEWEFVESLGNTEEEILNNIDSYLENGKKYLYVRNDNTIYWFERKIASSNSVSIPINVVYRDYERLQKDEILEVNSKSVGLPGSKKYHNISYYDLDPYIFNIVSIYHIKSPVVKFTHTQEGIIKVDKNVEGEVGNHTYYVGLFTNDTSKKANQIYPIDTIDGQGSITIEIGEFTSSDTYYIYETDINGNKISNVHYNKNKVELKDYVRDAKIMTDNRILSSVKSDEFDESKVKEYENIASQYLNRYLFISDLEKTIGTGEKDYIDNVLNVNDIYQEHILISSAKIECKVTYEAKEGGTIEGEKEEMVESGKTPKNIPIPKAEEGYEFVRWEVEKDGEKIEVDPSEYKVTEDIVIYAIFSKIPVQVPVDTSDRNIEAYIVIFLVAVIGVAVGIFVVKNNKKNAKKIK